MCAVVIVLPLLCVFQVAVSCCYSTACVLVCAGISVAVVCLYVRRICYPQSIFNILCKDSDFFLCVIAVDGYFFAGIVAFFCALFSVLFFV